MIKRFLAIGFSTQKLLIEIWFLLFIARITILLFPFKIIAKKLGALNVESNKTPIDQYYLLLLRDVKSCILIASKYTFWKSNCYTQALCCHWVLKRRFVEHTTYFGLLKDENNNIKAHAWTRSGNFIITGGPRYKFYKVTGMFAYSKTESSSK